jgi:3-oxoadipate enol-lactonase
VLAGTRPPAPAARLDDVGPIMDAVRGPASRESVERYFRRTWGSFAAPGFFAAHPGVLDEVVARIMRRPTPRRGVLDQIRAMSSWHGVGRLTRISAPTTVLHGDQDPLIPVDNGRILSELVPDARYVELAGVGHLVPYEAGEALIEVLACGAATAARS